MNNVPLYLKWALVFEDPESKTLWLGKAVPREWLSVGEDPINARKVPSRYGRVSFRMAALSSADANATYVVHVNVSVASGFATSTGAPMGGLRVRVRCPLAHAGRLSDVRVGGKTWPAFNASAETIDFDREALLRGGMALIVAMADIVASFTADTATPMKPAW